MKEQGLVDSKSESCICGGGGANVYPRIVISVRKHNKNPAKRVGQVSSGLHHHFIDN